MEEKVCVFPKYLIVRFGDEISSKIVLISHSCFTSLQLSLTGYKVLFEYSDKSSQRCTLVAAGNIEGLTLRLELGVQHKDPSPIVLHTFNITNDENLYTVRLFDYRMSMDVHVDPRRGARGRAKPIGDFWAIYFRGHAEQEIKNAKAMMRRVENITLEMPDKWFKVRISWP